MQRKVSFSVILVTMVTLWVTILVTPVAANPYEGGVVPGKSVSSHQVDSSSDGYAVDPYTRTASAKAEAKATVNVYQQSPPAPRYHRPYYTAPKPRAKRSVQAPPRRPRHTHTTTPARPKATPGKPFLTNKAEGSAFGAAILKSSIAVTPNGVVVKIMKGIMSGKPGSEWQFATPGHTLNINRPIGSLLRFIIAVRNTDSSDLPTDGIFVSDNLVSKQNSKAESGALFMGGTKIRELSADELTQLISGVKIPVGQYVDTIPAKGTLGIRYDVRIAGGAGGSKDPGNLPPTGDNLGSAGPSWWSKIDWGNIAFWAAIAFGCIVVLVGLIWLIRRVLGRANRRPAADDDDDDDLTRSRPFDLGAERGTGPIGPVAEVVEEEDEPALTMEQVEEAARRGTI